MSEPSISDYKKLGGGLVPDWLIHGPISFHVSLLPSLAFPDLFVLMVSRWLPWDWALCADTATARESLIESQHLSQKHPGDLHTYLIGQNCVTHP